MTPQQFACTIAQCAAHYRSSLPFEKKSIFVPSWGGGNYHLGTGRGIGGELGYSHALGLLPIPHIGIRAGTPNMGLSVGGPIPYIGIDNGVQPGASWSYPRSLWGYMYDRATGAPDPYTGLMPGEEEQQEQQKPPEKKKEVKKVKKKERLQRY